MGTWIGKVRKDEVMFVSAGSKIDALDFLERVKETARIEDLEAMTRGFYVTFKIHSDGTYRVTGISSNLADEIKAIADERKVKRKS